MVYLVSLDKMCTIETRIKPITKLKIKSVKKIAKKYFSVGSLHNAARSNRTVEQSTSAPKTVDNLKRNVNYF